MLLSNATEKPMTLLEVKPENIFSFPEGIPAFEWVKRFVILSKPEEAPFMWLQAVDEPGLAFIVTMPATFHPNYELELSDEDVHFLGLQSPDDALVLCIITVSRERPEMITANLAGPIIINWRTRVGKQVVPLNARDYDVRYDVLGELAKLEARQEKSVG